MASILFTVYDNGSMIPQPPHGVAYLAAAARDAGHSVSIFDAAVSHASPSSLISAIDDLRPDVVAISAIGGYWQHRQVLELCYAVNKSEHRKNLWLVLGGHGPAACPEYFLGATCADSVCVGEGETTFVNLLDCTSKPCIFQGDAVNVDAVPRPAWDLFDMAVYRLQRYPRVEQTQFAMPVLSGRGCPFKCSFCYRMVPGFRPRNPLAIAEEIEWLQLDYGVTYINFDDELLMAGESRTLDICEALSRLGINWMCNGRLNCAKPKLLAEMRNAGCVFINYGVECFDDNVLELMNKNLTCDQIERGVRATLEAGISPGLNVMWGNPGDTIATLRKTADFLKKYDDHAQIRTIRPVTPYPGSSLFDKAVAEGRLADAADFYVSEHTNSDLPSVQWTGLSNAEFCQALLDVNNGLVQCSALGIAENRQCQLRKLYTEQDSSFRGFRHT